MGFESNEEKDGRDLNINGTSQRLSVATRMVMGFLTGAFIPFGIFYGANVTWTQFFVVNLVPVTLGNIVGGSFFVGAIYWFIYEYERPGKVEKCVS